MGARFDHLVVSVADLGAAIGRWSEFGLAPQPGGRHPGGTENALVRGPRAAYLEIISTEEGAESDWADRVRTTQGPLGFAVAVDDIEAARAALVQAGFSPGEVTDGSRQAPDGSTLRWRLCQVGRQAFDPELPFLIEWTTPMPPGPADGPVLESVNVASRSVVERDRLVTMLRALDFPEEPSGTPGFTFLDGDLRISLPATEAEMRAWEQAASGSALYLRFGEDDDAGSDSVTVGPDAIGVGLPHGETRWQQIDGLSVTVYPDVRSHVGHVLLPAVESHFAARPDGLATWPDPHPDRDPPEEEYSRCLDPGKYRIIGARVQAWATALAEAQIAARVDHASGFDIVPRRPGAVPITVAITGFEGLADNGLTLSVDSPGGSVELLRLPDCGCDACDSGSADLLTQVDEFFLHVLDGGVYKITGGRGREVTTAYQGWSASGSFRGDEAEQWIADARAGRSRYEVLSGTPWL